MPPFGVTLAVGHDEHAVPAMGGASVDSTASEWRRNRVSQAFQSLADRLKMLKGFPDVFEENKSRSDCINDPEQVMDRSLSVVSQSARVREAALGTGDAVGLAGVAGGEQVDASGKQLGGKVGEIAAEHRTGCQALFFHTGEEKGRSRGFPFTESRSAILDASSGESDPNGFIEHSDAGEEGESCKWEGMSHTLGRGQGIGFRIQGSEFGG